MTTTVTIREASADVLTAAYPDLLPPITERKARGRGYQCVYQVTDVPALLAKMEALRIAHAGANVRASLGSDIERVEFAYYAATGGKKPAKSAAPVAAKAVPTATAAPVVEEETERKLVRVEFREKAHSCGKCRKQWDTDGAIHCEDCHVTYGDPLTFKAHALGEHNKFRRCLHPVEVVKLAVADGGMPIADNGDDVWAVA